MTLPVDAHPNGASAYGCQSMSGNVWEWCLDSFEDERNPHPLKGGCWQNSEEFIRNDAESYGFPENKRQVIYGFRIIYLPGDMLENYRSKFN